ncbi:MAG: hypothetical protein ACTHMX_07840 [Thermomicrobiales bacterium]|jgi:hypothetical protein
MMHIITSPSFTAYSQERLGSKVPRRVEEPEDAVASWVTLPETKDAGRGWFHAFSFDGLRRLFGTTPKASHS